MSRTNNLVVCNSESKLCQTSLLQCTMTVNQKVITGNQINQQIAQVQEQLNECNKLNPPVSQFTTMVIVIIIVCIISIVINIFIFMGSKKSEDNIISY